MFLQKRYKTLFVRYFKGKSACNNKSGMKTPNLEGCFATLNIFSYFCSIAHKSIIIKILPS